MSTLKHEFTAPPQHGCVLIDGRFSYVLAGSEPWTDREGAPTFLMYWIGRCAACDAPFEFVTGRRVYTLYRRCEACRPERGDGRALTGS